jgi:hypothetical protein
MENRKIIVDTAFNTFGFLEERLTKEWIEKRIDIFMKFTLQSLKNQSNQDFLSLIRYENSTEDYIRETLAKYPELPVNIKFIQDSYFESYLKNYAGDSPEIFITRIDSDNLYHKFYIQELRDYSPNESTQILISQDGYVYDCLKQRLAYWFHESTPFYTLIYKTENYLKGKRYKLTSHSKAIKLRHEILPAGRFIVLIHSDNTLGAFNSSMRRERITDPLLLRKTLQDFGVVL